MVQQTQTSMSYSDFAVWLDKTLNRRIPRGVVAFNFNIYEEDTEQYWAVELVGTTKTHEEDEDWACYDDLFSNRQTLLRWKEETEWTNIQKEVEDAVKSYLKCGRYRNVLEKCHSVGVGFVSGDISLVYENKGDSQPGSNYFWKSPIFILTLFFFVAVGFLLLLPDGNFRKILGTAFIVGFGTICGHLARTRMEKEKKEKHDKQHLEIGKRTAEEVNRILETLASRNLREPAILYGRGPASDAALPIGCSKFGGQPDVPQGFEWPMDDRGFPLSFLLQVDCADLTPYDLRHKLPTSGHLYFFYELREQDWSGMYNGVRVFYNDEPVGALRQIARPKELYELDDEFCLRERPLWFSMEYSIPSFADLQVLAPDIATQCDEMIYRDMYDDTWSATALSEQGVSGSLLGYADVIQNSMLSEGVPENDVLLMQMFSDSVGCDIVFGDLGNIYFYVTSEELKRLDFSKVHFELQCG